MPWSFSEPPLDGGRIAADGGAQPPSSRATRTFPTPYAVDRRNRSTHGPALTKNTVEEVDGGETCPEVGTHVITCLSLTGTFVGSVRPPRARAQVVLDDKEEKVYTLTAAQADEGEGTEHLKLRNVKGQGGVSARGSLARSFAFGSPHLARKNMVSRRVAPARGGERDRGLRGGPSVGGIVSPLGVRDSYRISSHVEDSARLPPIFASACKFPCAHCPRLASRRTGGCQDTMRPLPRLRFESRGVCHLESGGLRLPGRCISTASRRKTLLQVIFFFVCVVVSFWSRRRASGSGVAFSLSLSLSTKNKTLRHRQHARRRCFELQYSRGRGLDDCNNSAYP